MIAGDILYWDDNENGWVPLIVKKKKSKWISTESAYPDTNRYVLGYGAGSYHVVFYEDTHWKNQVTNKYFYISYWRELPKPPKESK